MANCAIRPSLLNKFTFKQLLTPSPGDSFRLVVCDIERNLCFSPEYNAGNKVLVSEDRGRTFRWVAAGPGFTLTAWANGGAGLVFLGLPGAASIKVTRSADGQNYAPAITISRDFSRGTPRTGITYGGGQYRGYQQTAANGYQPGYLQYFDDAAWSAASWAVAVPNETLPKPSAYCKGVFYGFRNDGGNASFRRSAGLSAAVAIDTNLTAAQLADGLVAARLAVVGRDSDTLMFLSKEGRILKSAGGMTEWTAGGLFFPGAADYSWSRIYSGRGLFGEYVLLVVDDHGEAGALSLDLGETWKPFALPEFCRYAGDWGLTEIAYIPDSPHGRWVAALGAYGLWELTPDYRA